MKTEEEILFKEFLNSAIKKHFDFMLFSRANVELEGFKPSLNVIENTKNIAINMAIEEAIKYFKSQKDKFHLSKEFINSSLIEAIKKYDGDK